MGACLPFSLRQSHLLLLPPWHCEQHCQTQWKAWVLNSNVMFIILLTSLFETFSCIKRTFLNSHTDGSTTPTGKGKVARTHARFSQRRSAPLQLHHFSYRPLNSLAIEEHFVWGTSMQLHGLLPSERINLGASLILTRICGWEYFTTLWAYWTWNVAFTW